MRDSSLEGYIADLEMSLNNTITDTYVFQNVMDSQTAGAIEDAAVLAFIGRWAEAERTRKRAGYDGLGLLDYGAVVTESEASRERFRKALDE